MNIKCIGLSFAKAIVQVLYFHNWLDVNEGKTIKDQPAKKQIEIWVKLYTLKCNSILSKYNKSII